MSGKDEIEAAAELAQSLSSEIERLTVNVNEEIDEDDWFKLDGQDPLVSRYDIEKAVEKKKKEHFVEEQRYWVNEPYAFVVIFHSERENEKKYYAIEPYMNRIESETMDFLSAKLRTVIDYEGVASDALGGDDEHRKEVIEDEARRLAEKYDIKGDNFGGQSSLTDRVPLLGGESEEEGEDMLEYSVRPEGKLLEEDSDQLSPYQLEKVLYYLKRDFIGFERIDPIKHDINIEDISCNGYNSPVFVYHSDYEQIKSNIEHGTDQLDRFVVKMAQRSGKGISKRQPQVDCTLPDGSRAQLTLGSEVSDHGTNYTIRQFKDVPFTPVDLINWNTFGLTEMAFLWLCIENNKSLIFAGGTASGKTTSLNAISIFIPSKAKIVSIEDTREVELPQRNWVASVTRPSFSGDDKGSVDEFDLLEAALRQRPDYIVMGEVRGEEGRDLFQVMSTGHTSYSTFHADSVGEVLKRFTTDPINVSKTLFTALDLVSIQAQTRVNGRKVRRNKGLTEVNYYDAENDEINVQDVYEWSAQDDEFRAMGRNETVKGTKTIQDIQFDRGWSEEEAWMEIKKRELVLAHLIYNEFSTYADVAATIQAFMNDEETTFGLIANDELEKGLEDLREMESVLIDINPEKEALVPRPSPDSELKKKCEKILEEGEKILSQYEEHGDASLEEALSGGDKVDDELKDKFEEDLESVIEEGATRENNELDFLGDNDGE